MATRRAVLGIAALLVCCALASQIPAPAVVPVAGAQAARAYVIARNGQVQVLDTRTGGVLSRDDTGAWTTGAAVSADGRRVYVVNGWAGDITAVEPGAGVVGRIDTGAQLAQAVLQPGGKRLYVTGSGLVAVVELEPFRVVATARVGRQPQGVAVSPDGEELYVANAQDGTVSVLDTKSATVITTVEVGGLPQQVAVSPDGGLVYVSSLHLGDKPGAITAIDAKTRRAVWSMPVGKGAGSVAVTPDGRRVYVALDGAVAVVDTATGTTSTLDLAAKSLAIPPGDRRVFLACGKTTTLLDSADDSVLATFHLTGLNSDGRGFEATTVAFQPVAD
ncbi:PQQ-binding-like beta-propeller repeat protein [Actinosynnema sp. NPDC050436]|uniref:YncE family protein n=1 Tax=Actinosynnema sp. NPDC050436 TaxID=3155659 RepID=UPI0033F8EDAC